MVDRMAARMRTRLKRTFLTTPVALERPTIGGGWIGMGTQRASIQHVREDHSPADPPEARDAEGRALRVYLAHDVVVDVGYRLQWDGAWWHVSRCTPARGEDVYRRIEAERPQLGTEPLAVTFFRRLVGSTLTVGTYTMLRTQDQASPLDNSVAGQFEANTASGASVTGSLVGGADAAAVQVGDWFSIGTMPGRVTSVDTSYADHTTIRYRMEQRGT